MVDIPGPCLHQEASLCPPPHPRASSVPTVTRSPHAPTQLSELGEAKLGAWCLFILSPRAPPSLPLDAYYNCLIRSPQYK